MNSDKPPNICKLHQIRWPVPWEYSDSLLASTVEQNLRM